MGFIMGFIVVLFTGLEVLYFRLLFKVSV